MRNCEGCEVESGALTGIKRDMSDENLMLVASDCQLPTDTITPKVFANSSPGFSTLGINSDFWSIYAEGVGQHLRVLKWVSLDFPG
jgi:hypothetical protein